MAYLITYEKLLEPLLTKNCNLLLPIFCMKRYRIISGNLFLIGFSLLAQYSFAQVSKKDSVAIFSMIDKAEFFFNESNYDSALSYCTKAEAFSKRTGFKKGQAYSLIEATDIYIDKDELEKAQGIIETSNRLGQQLKDSLITAITIMQMAQVKMYGNHFDDAIILFDKCIGLYPAAQPTRYAALAYNDFGYTWGRKGDLSRQAECLVKSITIYEKIAPAGESELAVALSNLSSVYYILGQRVKAIEYAKRSLAFREKQNDIPRLSLGCCNISQFYGGVDNAEAERYLKLCVKYATQSGQDQRMIHSYTTAVYFYNTKSPQTALEYELKAISVLEKIKKDSAMLARCYLDAGTISGKLKKDTSIVMGFYNKCLAILQTVSERGNLRDFYLQLSNYYRENGNPAEALTNYTKYILYKDSIITEKTTSSIAEIAMRYETKKKDDEISKLNINQQLRQLEIDKQKALIAGNYAEAKQKENEIKLLSQQQELQNVKIRQQAEELEKQFLVAKNNEQQLILSQQEKKLNESRLQSQRQLRNFMIAGIVAFLLFAGIIFNRYRLKKSLERQKELLAIRNDIARDLHDDIGSALTSIKILSEVSKNNLQKDSGKSARMLSQITEQSSQMQQGMSDIVWAIKPDNDKIGSMLIRMREYAAFVLEPKIYSPFLLLMMK